MAFIGRYLCDGGHVARAELGVGAASYLGRWPRARHHGGYFSCLRRWCLRAADGALSPSAVATTPQQAAKEAVLVALGNPKLIIFFVALLSQFVTPEMSLLAKAIIVATAIIIDGGWYVLVAVGLSHSRVLPWLQRHAHWINRMTGVLLIALALRVAAGPIL